MCQQCFGCFSSGNGKHQSAFGQIAWLGCCRCIMELLVNQWNREESPSISRPIRAHVWRALFLRCCCKTSLTWSFLPAAAPRARSMAGVCKHTRVKWVLGDAWRYRASAHVRSSRIEGVISGSHRYKTNRETDSYCNYSRTTRSCLASDGLAGSKGCIGKYNGNCVWWRSVFAVIAAK